MKLSTTSLRCTQIRAFHVHLRVKRNNVAIRRHANVGKKTSSEMIAQQLRGRSIMLGDIGIDIKGAAVNGGWVDAAAEVSDSVAVLSGACSVSVGTKSTEAYIWVNPDLIIVEAAVPITANKETLLYRVHLVVFADIRIRDIATESIIELSRLQ